LSQAEAVADLISSDNAASHQIAMQQMRGGFSNEIAKLREELLNFASLIELELDFAEEDVEFADRTQFPAEQNRICPQATYRFLCGRKRLKRNSGCHCGEPNGKIDTVECLIE
jgi:tRNA U34 5-carboxymethylaminomethyl modifying GTPase MnmE/TrmE